MKTMIFGFSCAVILAGWTYGAKGDPTAAPTVEVITNSSGPATNISGSRPAFWPITPRDPSGAAGAPMVNTNTVVLVGGETNTPTPAATTPAPAPPPVAPAGGTPDSIQSSPTLQGSSPDKGPI